jgi:hypothetical protein
LSLPEPKLQTDVGVEQVVEANYVPLRDDKV